MNAWYNREGDILHITIEAVDSYSEWHPSGVHLQRSHDDQRIVGVDVWWLSRILNAPPPTLTAEERAASDALLSAAVPDYAGELARITPDAATLSRMAAEHPPPQAWYDETDDPTKIRDESEENPTGLVPRTPLGERLATIRQRMLAAGQATVSWEELDRELGREQVAPTRTVRTDAQLDALSELIRKT